MSADPARRAEQNDRDQVAAILRENMAGGRLSLSDYRARLRLVRSADTVDQLRRLLRDLPVPPGSEYDPYTGPWRGDSEAASSTSTSRPRRLTDAATLQRIFLALVALGIAVSAIVWYAQR